MKIREVAASFLVFIYDFKKALDYSIKRVYFNKPFPMA